MNNKGINTTVFLCGVSLMSFVAGCGNNNPAPPVPPSVISGPVYPGGGGTCGNGPYAFTDPNCPTDFVTACVRAGGVASQNTCAIPVSRSISSMSGILNPGNTSGPLAGSGLTVRAGDWVSFSGMGKWGTMKSSESDFLSIFHWTWTKYNCDKVDLSGRDDEGHTLVNQNLEAGLIGAIAGTNEAFLLGDQLVNHQFQHGGVFRIGINAPSNLPGICGGYSGTVYITSGLL